MIMLDLSVADPGSLRTAAAAGFFVAVLLMTLLTWRGA